MAYVHKKCQQEWRTKHTYAVPENLPILCRNHDEKYRTYVRFNAREIPWLENGDIPGSQLRASTERVVPRKKLLVRLGYGN